MSKEYFCLEWNDLDHPKIVRCHKSHQLAQSFLECKREALGRVHDVIAHWRGIEKHLRGVKKDVIAREEVSHNE